jgi:DNA-binding transcriptional LysR family regulator
MTYSNGAEPAERHSLLRLLDAQSTLLGTYCVFKETIAMSDQTPEQLAGMAVFARVVEARSFSGGARALGLTKSAVSKRIARLEAQMGVQLMRRTTRSLSLTDAGRTLYDRASHAITLCREAQGALSELSTGPRGMLRITAPMTFGRLRLAPLLPEFLGSYPDLQIQLVLLDRPVDLADEGFDLAIRLTKTLPAGVVARKLEPIQFVLCCAPNHFTRGTLPRTPADLQTVNCLRYGEGDPSQLWRFDGPEGSRSVRVHGNYLVNNSELLRDAVLQRIGIAILPRFVVAEDLRAGRIKQLMPDWKPRAPFGTNAYAIWLSDRHLPPKMRLFIDFLLQRFNDLASELGS